MMFHTSVIIGLLSHVDLAGLPLIAKTYAVSFNAQAELEVSKRSSDSTKTRKTRLKYYRIDGILGMNDEAHVDLELETRREVRSSWYRKQSSPTDQVRYQIKHREGHDTYYQESEVKFELSNHGQLSGTYDNRARSNGEYHSGNRFYLSNGPYIPHDRKTFEMTIQDTTYDIDSISTQFEFKLLISEFKAFANGERIQF